jgi:uncharacterized membrane-anchored protein
MKLTVALLLISANISFTQVNFAGNTNYSQQNNKQLTSSNKIEHLFKIYEDRKILVSISNALNVDLDCFKNEIKETNVFTTLQIEF